MKKKFKLENLDCANCAAKMEHAVKKIDGVDNCKISFITQRMTLETNEESYDQVIESAKSAINKIDRNVQVTSL